MFFETSSILPRTKTCQLPSALCSSDFKAKKKKLCFSEKKISYAQGRMLTKRKISYNPLYSQMTAD